MGGADWTTEKSKQPAANWPLFNGNTITDFDKNLLHFKQLQLSAVNDKNPKELRWQAGKGLKNITQKRTANGEYDRAEHMKKINVS